MLKRVVLFTLLLTGAVACKKEGCMDPNAPNFDQEAEKDDGSCETSTAPTSYVFQDENGNSTVNYSGQTDRLNQLREMVVLMKDGNNGNPVNAQILKDMFANVGDNGNGNFSFSSTKQLKDKCFVVDTDLFENWMDSIALASQSGGVVASNGQAGIVTASSGSSYLVDQNGIEYVQLIEKGLMGAVFMHQALNVYFGSDKMDVDNSSAEDPSNGKYYTAMEHHFDEAFGYFGVETDFPSTIPNDFWGKYCDRQDAALNSNADMMNGFIAGRFAITQNNYLVRDEAIEALRTEWEEISANQAITYIQGAIDNFGTDDGQFLHELSEAYAFAWNLRYAPSSTRRMSQTEHAALMNQFKENFWDMTIADLNGLKTTLNAKY
jgi:hypothetical protein